MCSCLCVFLFFLIVIFIYLYILLLYMYIFVQFLFCCTCYIRTQAHNTEGRRHVQRSRINILYCVPIYLCVDDFEAQRPERHELTANSRVEMKQWTLFPNACDRALMQNSVNFVPIIGKINTNFEPKIKNC